MAAVPTAVIDLLPSRCSLVSVALLAMASARATQPASPMPLKPHVNSNKSGLCWEHAHQPTE